MAYDVAIQACEQSNLARATQAVSLLREALNFDYPETAVGLFRLYQWTLECIRAGDYAAALDVLRPLREAWAAVERQSGAAAFAPAPRDHAAVLAAA
jgi:hypothetical protein